MRCMLPGPIHRGKLLAHMMLRRAVPKSWVAAGREEIAGVCIAARVDEVIVEIFGHAELDKKLGHRLGRADGLVIGMGPQP